MENAIGVGDGEGDAVGVGDGEGDAVGVGDGEEERVETATETELESVEEPL